MRKFSAPGVRAGYRQRSVWSNKGRIAAVSAVAAAALTATSMAGAPAASAGPTETVIVTSTGLLSPSTAVLQRRRHGPDPVPPHQRGRGHRSRRSCEPVLDALPGITVTPDATVSVQSTTRVDRAAHPVGRLPASRPGRPSWPPAATPARASPWPSGHRHRQPARLRRPADRRRRPDRREQPVPGQLRARHLRGRPDRRQRGLVERPVLGRGARRQPGVDQGGRGERHDPPGHPDPGPAVGGRPPAAAYGIKVLNMSLGFQPGQSTVINPLDQAVEAVWNSGIAVVASAGQRRAVQRHHPVPRATTRW